MPAVVASSSTATLSFFTAPGALLRVSSVSLMALLRVVLLFSYWPVPVLLVVPLGTWMLSGPSTPPVPVPLPLYASRLMLSDSAPTVGSWVKVSRFVSVWSKFSSAVVVTTAWPGPTTESSMFCSDALSRFW